MDQDSSTQCWNQLNIDEWITKAQTNDFRMFYMLPYTLKKLGDVKDKCLLDLGCGEGGYSRALAHKGAIVTSADCSEVMIEYAKNKAKEEGLKIDHYVRNANLLNGIGDNCYDTVLCAMMLMDVEDLEGTLKEIHRVLKPKGKVFISILHPCFKGKETTWIKKNGSIEVLVSDYHHPAEWVGEIKGINAPIIYRHRTLSDYIRAFVQTGFKITDLNEPIPTEEQARLSPRVAWLNKIPMYLFIELEK
jgi:2-polyprenyl-3-methyl-5-hydroxy-6-metoxy-1,4-benzoquinol methylase